MPTHGPWTIEERAKKYGSAFVDLFEDRVTRPDGSPGTYTTVTLKPGVAVLPIGAHGEVHLTRQFRYALGRESIEVVAGAIEADEDPREAGRRELREELGLVAAEWHALGTIDLDTSIVRCRVRLFTAAALRQTDVDPDPTEDIRPQTCSLADAVRMVLDGEITHSPSCVLILAAAQRHRS